MASRFELEIKQLQQQVASLLQRVEALESPFGKDFQWDRFVGHDTQAYEGIHMPLADQATTERVLGKKDPKDD